MPWSSPYVLTNWIELAVFFVLLITLAPLLARWLIASIKPSASEASCFASLGVDLKTEMNWKQYSLALLFIHLIGAGFLFLLLLTQGSLPLNPMHIPGMSWDLALNTAVSFVTNTNWQAYSGESQLSYLSQMLGLGVQNFLSAAVGIAVAFALARSLAREKTSELGNFWFDLWRVTTRFLLPMAALFAVFLISQGVVQSFDPYVTAKTIEGTDQVIPLGPAASQVAIKQLGTNGGGFFGVNSAHPFENPTPLSNFLQLLAILLIPAAIPLVFGRMSGHQRHGRMLFGVMLGLFTATLAGSLYFENMANMEGKEVRFGVFDSALWSSVTTVASNGSVNAMHDSLMPGTGGLAMFNMQLGEIVFGGTGSGLYGMVLFAVLTVFLCGLMVGRTPEYLGKKIGGREVIATSIGILLPSLLILGFTALACVVPAALAARTNSGPHGFSEILYAFTSGAANNGSAFGGLSVNSVFYNVTLSIAMVLGRFGVILPVLFIAGSFAKQKTIPPSAGTLSSTSVTFALLLVGVILIVGALTFIPALTLGPIVEHLLLPTGKKF